MQFVSVLFSLAVAQMIPAATSPTVPSRPEPDPLASEFEIQRTSEPLGLVNNLPPPLPLEEVRRLTMPRPTTAPAAAISAPVSTSITAAISAPRPLPPVPSLSVEMDKARRGLSEKDGVLRSYRPKATAAPSVATAGNYRDLVVLEDGKELACRIFAETQEVLKVELPTGVVVNLPKRRVKAIKQNAVINERERSGRTVDAPSP